MATTNQVRKLHYRRARLHKIGGTLQHLLSTAMRGLQHPKDRLQALNGTASSEASEHQLINYVSTQRGMLCGNMFVYAQGAAQLLMRAEEIKNAGDEAGSYPIESLNAPTKDGLKREFLESILYFCVYGDHVLILQARGLRVGAFEQYIGWLLERGNVLSGDQKILLADQATTRAAGAIRRSHVKSVSMGLPLTGHVSARQDGSKARIKVGGPIIKALRELIGPEVDHMRLEDALDGNIEATIELRWSRSTTEPAQRILDKLAVALRNIEPDEVDIVLNDGTTVKGDDLKLVVPVTVKARENIVDQSSLFGAMRDAMTTLIENRAIET